MGRLTDGVPPHRLVPLLLLLLIILPYFLLLQMNFMALKLGRDKESV
jgi:hypothetical protein